MAMYLCQFFATQVTREGEITKDKNFFIMNKNINHFENEGECIQVEGGDVGRWGALVSGDPGTPSPERGEGVVDEDGYQVVTRARGKQKVNVKAIPKTVSPLCSISTSRTMRRREGEPKMISGTSLEKRTQWNRSKA